MQPLYTFLQSNYLAIKTEHAEKLIEAAGLVASVLEGDDKIKAALLEISQIPLSLLKKYTDRTTLLRSLKMLLGFVRAIDDLPAYILSESFFPLYQECWGLIKKVYTQHYNDVEIIDVASEFVFKSVNCLKRLVVPLFVETQDTLLTCFMMNSQCCSALKVYA